MFINDDVSVDQSVLVSTCSGDTTVESGIEGEMVHKEEVQINTMELNVLMKKR